MSNVAKIAVPLLLLAAAAGGTAYYLSSQPGGDVTPVIAPPVQDPTPQPKVEPAAPEPVRAPAPTTTTETSRVAASSNNSNADAPQGVRGRVLQPNGTPAASVRVLLLESAANNPIEMFLKQKTGRITPPLADVQTGQDGTFQLGLRQVGKAVDFRVVSEEFPEASQQSIKVRDGDWYDMGDVRLEAGVLVSGRVVDQKTKQPIQNANVYLVNSAQSYAMVAAPGRERGIPSTTDRTGAFGYPNAPRSGHISLSAEAAGYASGQLLNQQIKPDAENDFTIELETGMPIAGIVVDPNGKPIAGANLSANGLSSKTPQAATTVSASDGRFEFPALRTGPYQLAANSPHYADVKMPIVMTGELEVKLVMSQRGAVKLKVLAANNQAVKAYRVSLKRYFENSPMGIANVPEFGDRSINPSDYPADLAGEWALVRGLPAGAFRFQVTDNAHAKTLSDPFTIEEGGAAVEVVVKLTQGGTITGTVIDDRGQPVADAAVSTDHNAGLAADTPLMELFGNMIPEKHTKTQTRTDAQGRFRISRLAYADYMLRAAHPDYCEGKAINLKLEGEGQVVDAGVIQLSRGALLTGVTMVGGLPAGQIKVTVSTPMTADILPVAAPAGSPQNAPPTLSKPMFNANVLSDGDGRFELRKRIPPGTYKITASRQGGGNPFDTLIDMKETERTLTVAPGQDSIVEQFNLTKR